MRKVIPLGDVPDPLDTSHFQLLLAWCCNFCCCCHLPSDRLMQGGIRKGISRSYYLLQEWSVECKREISYHDEYFG